MKRFELTEDHIKLLQHMYVDWWDCEFGAPCIDPKKPYGNSDVHEDMLKILEWKSELILRINGKDYEPEIIEMDYDMPAAVRLSLDELHKQTQTALQIVLVTKSFTPGTYKCEDYTEDWRLVDGTK